NECLCFERRKLAHVDVEHPPLWRTGESIHHHRIFHQTQLMSGSTSRLDKRLAVGIEGFPVVADAKVNNLAGSEPKGLGLVQLGLARMSYRSLCQGDVVRAFL